MLRIRLCRVGKKKRPSYRIVVADSASPRDGAFVDWIGHYDPLEDPPKVTLNEDRAISWLNKGSATLGPSQKDLPVEPDIREGLRSMKELIEYIARGLASQPDDVKVTEEVEEDRVVFKLEVAAEDKGKIIGRQGRVAQAMRVLLRVAAVKNGTRAVLEIV